MRGTVKPMLYAGGSFVLMPDYEPRTYLDALAKYRCTYSRGVAAVFTMFLQHRTRSHRSICRRSGGSRSDRPS